MISVPQLASVPALPDYAQARNTLFEILSRFSSRAVQDDIEISVAAPLLITGDGATQKIVVPTTGAVTLKNDVAISLPIPNANTVLAGPDGGSPAAAAFRQLVLPDIDLSGLQLSHIDLPVGDTSMFPPPSDTNTALDWWRHSWSTGITDPDFSTLGITLHGAAGTVDVGATDFITREGTSEDAPLVAYGDSGTSGLACTANDVTYVYRDWNGGTPIWQTGVNISDFNGTDKVIGWAVARNGTRMNVLSAQGMNVDFQRKVRRKNLEFTGYKYGPFWQSILGPSTVTASGLNILVGVGKYFWFENPHTHAAFDTSVAGAADANNFIYFYNRTPPWTQITGQKSIDATQYDNGGVLTAMTANKWRTDWLYVVLDAAGSPYLAVIMGNAQYTSQALAAGAPQPVLPHQIDGCAVLIAQLTIKKSAATFTVAQAGGTTFAGVGSFAAGALEDTTGTVDVASSAAPGGAGYFLISTSTTAATWQQLASKFIVQGTTDSLLPNAQFLGALGTGYVKNTTTTGVLTVQAAPIPVADGGTGTTTAFTLGSIPYAGASGVYTQDNANFFWDATNKRLGIGWNSALTQGLSIAQTVPGVALKWAANTSYGTIAFTEISTWMGGFNVIGSNFADAARRNALEIIAAANNAGWIAFRTLVAGTEATRAYFTNTGVLVSANIPATSTANTVFAGPTSGGAAAAAFRALVAADVPTLNQNTTGSAAKWTTARLLAGNSVDGSANVPFANKFIVQGTADTGLSGAQFLGALGTGYVKNATTTGILTVQAVPIPVADGGSGTTTAFTAGSVLFAGASGVYAQDNTNFFWDASNHRLGLGNASPGVLLDLYQSGAGTLLNIAVPGANRASMTMANGTNITWIAAEAAAGGTFTNSLAYASCFGTQGAQATQFVTNSIVRATIDSAGLFGIGTNAPGALLTVDANTADLQAPPAGTITQLGGANSTNPIVMVDAYAGSPILMFRRTDTSAASPSAVQMNENLGVFQGRGRKATVYSGNQCGFNMVAAENWDDTHCGTLIQFYTTPLASTTLALRAYIPAGGGFVVGDAVAALATTATDGFLYIPTCAGAPTGVPTAQAGTVPIIFDTTNNFLYVRTGGGWKKSTVYA